VAGRRQLIILAAYSSSSGSGSGSVQQPAVILLQCVAPRTGPAPARLGEARWESAPAHRIARHIDARRLTSDLPGIPAHIYPLVASSPFAARRKTALCASGAAGRGAGAGVVLTTKPPPLPPLAQAPRLQEPILCDCN
jgi:hypothetical protein